MAPNVLNIKCINEVLFALTLAPNEEISAVEHEPMLEPQMIYKIALPPVAPPPITIPTATIEIKIVVTALDD